MSEANGKGETDSMSSASGSLASNEPNVTEDSNFNIETDLSFDDAVNKLDELKLEPDSDLSEIERDTEHDSGSIGAESTGSKDIDGQAGQTETSSKKGKSKSTTKKENDSDKNDEAAKITKKRSMFDRLKRLTKFEKKSKEKPKSNYARFRGIKVDRLPVCFVAKYIGSRETKGLFGLEHVREPVDELVAKVKDDLISMDRVELPLCYMVFSSKGIDIREHSSNKMPGLMQYGLHSIDYISYGVQDMKYWRVFTFIVVNEISLRKKKTECHVFIADSTQSARKMALALGACFSIYKKKLNADGKSHNFQVELRPPDELVGNLEDDVEA